MGKGMTPKKGYDDKKYKSNYDSIDWSGVRKNKQGLMGSKTRVHEDKRNKLIDKIHNDDIKANE
jgi:hypothetical protein|tara:strand:- start:545 stop:736 length:192 start_codon:yes stop_codon:yes gene_type:complete